MRRLSVLASLLAVLLVGLALGARFGAGALAQDGTPPPEEEFELPEGVSFAALGYGTAEDVPAAPAELFLFRIGLEPGANFPLEPETSVALVYVEAGELTAVIEIPMTVLRAASAGTPFPEATEAFAAGEEFTMAEGDSAIFPQDAAGELRNDGGEAVSLLVADVGPPEDGGDEAGTPAP